MTRTFVILIVLALATYVLGEFLDPRGYAARVLCLVLLAASLGQAWNVIGGLANQISLGHAAYFGIGAYATTILQIRYGISPWIGVFGGMGMAAAAAALLSFPTMRLKGPYFALASLAFSEVCRIIASALPGLTGGPQGMSVPFLGDAPWMMQFRHAGDYLPIFIALFVFVYGTFTLMANGRMGYLLRAVREDEQAAEVSGVDTFGIKLTGSLVSAMLTAAIGTLSVQFTYFLDPDTAFSATDISIRAALIAIIGGVGTLWGPLFGAIVVVLLEETLSAYLSNASAGAAPLTFGLILVAIVLVRPRGLASLLPGKK